MIDYCKKIELPKIQDPRGNLSIIEQYRHIPFEIKRVYWIYDVPGGFDRGEHAYKETQEFVVALSGSFDVVLDNGTFTETYHLNRSYNGVFVPNGIWRKMTNFSTNSVALVLSSTEYNDNDYIMDYDAFLDWKNGASINLVAQTNNTSIRVNTPSTGILKNTGRSVFDCSLCELNKMHDPEGNLTYIYENIHVPFNINRVFYSYDIPGGEDRGAHAHKKCHQFIIAASGAFEVVLDDGLNKRTVTLNRPFWGLHVPPGIWAKEQGFSSGSICLVLASHEYDECDYIREYEDFITFRKDSKTL